jgi:hypothetical protein
MCVHMCYGFCGMAKKSKNSLLDHIYVSCDFQLLSDFFFWIFVEYAAWRVIKETLQARDDQPTKL